MNGLKLPSSGQVLTEAAVVIAGAIVAALIIGQLPAVRQWIASQWGEAGARGGCSCND